MSISIRLAGKDDRIPAKVFLRSLENFLELVEDVDSAVSRRSGGSVRWELSALTRNSPAVAEFAGTSRLKTGDFSGTVQYSVVDGLARLAAAPEQPQYYSYSALKHVQVMAVQAKHLEDLTILSGSEVAVVDARVRANVEYLIGAGGFSLGSVRGSLDALTIHSGHEFRVWPSRHISDRPIACRFSKGVLKEVVQYLKHEVEVFGRVKRNSKGQPVFVQVEHFHPLEPLRNPPSIKEIKEMSGLVDDLYGGLSLKEYLEELRNG